MQPRDREERTVDEKIGEQVRKGGRSEGSGNDERKEEETQRWRSAQGEAVGQDAREKKGRVGREGVSLM
eukprot:6177976-Pleurochrysis_carterae.AAC.2